MQVGNSSILATAQSSKMCRASRGSRQPRPVALVGAEAEVLTELLHQYEQSLARRGQRMGRYLFSPLRPDHQGYQGDKGLSPSAMGQRVVYHLKRMGLYEGESLYSIKRGDMQYDYFVLGRSQQAIGEDADINTPAVVSAYLDPSRHVSD